MYIYIINLIKKKWGLNTFLVLEFWKLYFLIPEFQFASQIVSPFWKKTKLVPQSSFPSKN